MLSPVGGIFSPGFYKLHTSHYVLHTKHYHTTLHLGVAFATILPIVNNIVIALTDAMAIDITLADATMVVFVHLYQEKISK